MAAVSASLAAENFNHHKNSNNDAQVLAGDDVVVVVNSDGGGGDNGGADSGAEDAEGGSGKTKLEGTDSNVSSSGRASGAAAGKKGAAGSGDKEKKIGHRRMDEEGQITYKKIQTSQIMNSIQLGVAHAVGSLASKPERDLLMQDFAVVETVYFAKEGSQHTPAHHNQDFRFKIYAPMAFRYFRDLFGIQPDDFLVSMCDSPLKELSNAGASGSIFYLTIDDEFITKTVQHKEAEFLQKLLPGYYMNLNQNPRTLLPKFFGLYCYQCNSKNVRLIVMNNLLPSSIRYHQKYDLKGSTYKRKANKYERNKKSPTFKDLDFIEHHAEGLMLEAETYMALMKTIQRDCRVLESFKIMDYSLLMGVHNLDQAAKDRASRHSPSPMSETPNSDTRRVRKYPGSGDPGVEMQPYPKGVSIRDGPASLEIPSAADSVWGAKGNAPGPALTRSKSLNRQRLVAHSTAMESIQAQSEPIDEDDNVPPGGIPARNAQGERLLLFLGIIDILQSYRLKKRLEHTFKSVIHDGDSVSVHNPTFYSERFRSFMEKKVFKKIPSRLSHVDHHRIKGFAGDALPIGSTPPPGFDEAIRGGPNNMFPVQVGSGARYFVPDSTAHSVRSHSTYSSNSSTVTSRQEVENSVRMSHVMPQCKSSPIRRDPASSASASESTSSTSGVYSGGNLRASTWTPPLSSENNTWTEGTPSFTESSSSEGHTPHRSRNASRESAADRSRDLDEETPHIVVRVSRV